MLTGLDLPAFTSFDDWTNIGRALCTAGRKLNWLIGDWLIAGSDRFGDKARDEANAIFRADVERFDPILKTCRRFPQDKRHGDLTFGHHLAVLMVADDREADALLTKAESERLSVAAFKATVRVTTNRQPQLEAWSDDTVEDREYRAMAQAWNRASTTEARRMFAEAIEDVGIEGEIEL